MPHPPLSPAPTKRLRLPRTFTALRHPNFRLFYFGQLISVIGSWMQNTAQGWLVVLLASQAAIAVQGTGAASRGEGQANLYLGIIAAAGSVPMLFGALYGGIIADRYSKKRILLCTQTALMCLALGLSALIASGQARIGHVIAYALLTGIVNVFDIPARQSFVVDMVGKDDLPNAIALNSALFNAARAFGPAVAGLLIAAFKSGNEAFALAMCFLYNGLSYVAVLTSLLRMRGDFAPKSSGRASPLAQIQEVKDYLLEKRAALLLVILVMTFSVFVAPYFILLPSLARFTLGVDAQGFGTLMSCQGAGALCGALTVATLSEHPRKGRILTAASLVFPVLLLLLSVSRVYLLSCALIACIGFTMITFLSNANALLQTSTPDHLRGRIMGVYSLILMGMTPVGSLWAGLVANKAGAPTAVAVGALIMGAVTLFTAIRYPRFRGMGRTLPESL